MPSENSQEPNSSETSDFVEEETTLEQKSVEPTQLDVELVNPNTLTSRQTPSKMSGSKVKRLRKKIYEKGFDPKQPIEVTDIDGKLIIVDGHHRAVAARQLSLKSVPIVRLKVTRPQAEQLLRAAVEAEIYKQY